MKLKLKQINEDQKCPKCKKYTLVEGCGYIDVHKKSVFFTLSDVWAMGGLSSSYIIEWNWQCTNCNAQFIYEDLKNGNKNNN